MPTIEATVGTRIRGVLGRGAVRPFFFFIILRMTTSNNNNKCRAALFAAASNRPENLSAHAPSTRPLPCFHLHGQGMVLFFHDFAFFEPLERPRRDVGIVYLKPWYEEKQSALLGDDVRKYS